MLAKIKSFFEINIQPEAQKSSREQIQLAAAALLIELTMADREVDPQESAMMLKILHQRFGITQDKLDELVAMAKEEVSQSTSLFQFTRLVNDFYTAEDKFDLIKAMWDVAYADGDIDKYEEALIRKISELIYVPHSHFIKAKHLARDGE